MTPPRISSAEGASPSMIQALRTSRGRSLTDGPGLDFHMGTAGQRGDG